MGLLYDGLNLSGSCADNDEKGQDGFGVGGHMIGPDDKGFTGVKLPRNGVTLGEIWLLHQNLRRRLRPKTVIRG